MITAWGALAFAVVSAVFVMPRAVNEAERGVRAGGTTMAAAIIVLGLFAAGFYAVIATCLTVLNGGAA